MTFFERYFELLDGPDPHSSLELVAEDVEFSIQWAADDSRKSSQFLGGLDELRGFIDAGDTEGWAHYVLHSGVSGDVEFALGETRWDIGERIGTFLAVAELDESGRMRRYMVARSPVLAFARCAMTETRQLQLIDPELIGGTEQEPRLIGSVCERCGTVTFPRQRSCPRCTSEDVHAARAGHARRRCGRWTIQCFAPKAPPYLEGGVEEFEPYGVGYIELPGEVRVEARLTESDPERLRIGMPMELTLIPVPGASDKLTFAFRPVRRRTNERGEDVAVVGLGIHPFGRHDGVTGLEMGAIAARRALASAGIDVAGRRLRRRRVGRRRQRRHVGVDARADRRPVHQRQERLRDRGIGADHRPRDARLGRGRGRARGRLRQAPARRVQPAARGLGDRLLVRRDRPDAHDAVLRA